MLLTMLTAMLACLLGAIAGIILAFVLAIAVIFAIWCSSDSSHPDMGDVYRWFLGVIPTAALFAIVAVLIGPSYPLFLAGLGFGLCIILAVQAGRAYEYYK